MNECISNERDLLSGGRNNCQSKTYTDKCKISAVVSGRAVGAHGENTHLSMRRTVRWMDGNLCLALIADLGLSVCFLGEEGQMSLWNP